MMYTRDNLTIEQLKREHVDEVMKLYELMALEIWPDMHPDDRQGWLRRRLKDLPGKTRIQLKTYFIRINGRMIAIASWYCYPNRPVPVYELDGVYISQEFRNKGIGTVLLDYRLDKIRENCNNAFREILVQTIYNKIYHSRGFVPTLRSYKQMNIPLETFYGMRCNLITYYIDNKILNRY